MNDEPSSSAQPAPPPQQQHDAPLTAKEINERRKKNRDNFNRRRGELLDDLIRNVDLLVYAELSAIYYMDCSFLRFILRTFVQLVWLTPKPPLFPEAPPNRPYIGMIFGTNILCILLHIWSSAPSAGEATRGYLHGGLAMDFIGQKGPSSKIHLLLLDLLVVFLQIVHLSAHLLRQRLKEAPAEATTTTGDQSAAGAPSTGQNLDDEERGVRHSNEQQNQEDIEMQTLNPAGRTAESNETSNEPESSERESLLASTSMPQHTDARIFDAFNSGQIVLGDFDLVKTVREQFLAYQKAPRDANSAEANRLMRERLAARMLRWRFEAPTVMGRTLGS